MGQFESFLAMGGHGAFVWGAYGVCAVVLVALTLASLRRLRASEAALRRLEQRRGGRPDDRRHGGDTLEPVHEP